MPPFGSLPWNLVAFVRHLRRGHGFLIGARELHDAARALELVDLGDRRAVRDALRPILSRTRDEARVFDEAFDAFFLSRSAAAREPAPGADRSGDGERALQASSSGPSDSGPLAGETDGRAHPAAEPAAILEPSPDPAHIRLFASYSPFDLDGLGEAPLLRRPPRAWRDAARAAVGRLHAGASRRWRPAPRGPRIDPRRMLRASLQTGGDAVAARWLRRRPRAPAFVLLLDGSRSMGPAATAALDLALALAAATMRVEVFTFSTALSRVTPDIRRAVAGEARRLEHLDRAWAGGTSIGRCLHDFLRRFAGRLVGPSTIVIIVSDGLDVGEPEALAAAMRELRARSAALVWLNPLADTPGYEPTAAGMRAALPYVTAFTSVSDPARLARLGRIIRLPRPPDALA